MKLADAKPYEALILATKTPDELKVVMDDVIQESGFRFDYDADYLDNSITADMSLQCNLARLFRMAHKREQAML